MRNTYRIMPDPHVDIDEIIAEGDKVVCRNRWHGTLAKTGKRMEFHGFAEWRFEGNRIAERWATVTPPAGGPLMNARRKDLRSPSASMPRPL